MNQAIVNSWDWLSVTKDIIEIIFYVVTGTVVVLGLRSWRQELKGRSKYETAKNVIAGAYRVRDVIDQVRLPWVLIEEKTELRPEPNEPEKERPIKEKRYVYTKRYGRVAEALSQWYPSIVEAEALLGEEGREKIKALDFIAQWLKHTIRIHFDEEMEFAQGHAILSPKMYDQDHNILFGIHHGEAEKQIAEGTFDDGGFQADLDLAVQGIKEYFEQFIK